VHVDALDGAAALDADVEGALRHRGSDGGDRRVVADVDRILAAELELDVHEAPRRCLRDAAAGGVRAGEEDAVERGVDQCRADLAGADHGDEGVVRHARRVQPLGDREAGEGRILRRLVEDRASAQQRRHEDIAADEIGIVPRRDVGDDAERFPGDALGETGAAVVVNDFRREHPRRVGEEKIDAALRGRDLGARLDDRFAHLTRQRTRECLRVRPQAIAKARQRRQAVVERRRRPPRLRGARAGHLLGEGRRGVDRNASDLLAGSGVGDDERGHRRIGFFHARQSATSQGLR
jgi:hypothetical protein